MNLFVHRKKIKLQMRALERLTKLWAMRQDSFMYLFVTKLEPCKIAFLKNAIIC